MTTPKKPRLTPAQWALLGRMSERGVVVRRAGWSPSGWESKPQETATYGYRARKVRDTVLYALEEEGFIECNKGEEHTSHLRKDETWSITFPGGLAWRTRKDRHTERSTNDPCHGCESTDEHKKDRLCQDCQTILHIGRQARDLEAAEPVGEVVVKVRRVVFPYRTYHIGENRDAMAESLTGLVSLLLHPMPVENWEAPKKAKEAFDLFPNPNAQEDHREGIVYYWGDPEAVWILHHLHAQMRLAMNEAYEMGHQQGSTLIGRLAEGEITIDEYQDKLSRQEA